MKKLAIYALLVSSTIRSNGQITIVGPTCVMPGLTYQYVISGPWDSASTMQVCLTGGLIAGTNSSCTSNGPVLSSILVTWNTGLTGSLNVSSSKGTNAYAITITSALAGGHISASTKIQSVVFKGTPAVIACSASTGGSCSPSYQYQWQQSFDRLNWSDIPGAKTQDLSLNSALQEAIFFRRRVTEQNTGTVAYSDEAVIGVQAPPPATILNN